MLLEVNNVRKVYTTRLSTQSTEALKNVNFAVDNGEYVAIMGESGSGKTTLLNIIATFDKATSGNVNLNNLDKDNAEKIEELLLTNPELTVILITHRLDSNAEQRFTDILKL